MGKKKDSTTTTAVVKTQDAPTYVSVISALPKLETFASRERADLMAEAGEHLLAATRAESTALQRALAGIQEVYYLAGTDSTTTAVDLIKDMYNNSANLKALGRTKPFTSSELLKKDALHTERGNTASVLRLGYLVDFCLTRGVEINDDDFTLLAQPGRDKVISRIQDARAEWNRNDNLPCPAGLTFGMIHEAAKRAERLKLADDKNAILIELKMLAAPAPAPAPETPNTTPSATPGATPGATPSATPSATPGATPGAKSREPRTPIALDDRKKSLAAACTYALGRGITPQGAIDLADLLVRVDTMHTGTMHTVEAFLRLCLAEVIAHNGRSETILKAANRAQVSHK